MNKTKLKSNFLLLMTAMIWGFAFVAQRVGADHVGAMTFNGVRFALGALSLVPVVLIFARKTPMDRECRRQTVYASLAGGTALFGMLAMMGDVGCSAGPSVVGLVSGAFHDELKAGLLAAMAFPLILVLGIQGLKKVK